MLANADSYVTAGRMDAIRKTRPRQGGKSIAENSYSRFDGQIADLLSRLFFMIRLQYFFLFPLTASAFSDGV